MMVSEPWVLVPALVLNSSFFLWWGWGGWGDECKSHCSRQGRGLLETGLLSCPGALRTRALCLEAENKNDISYKTSSCAKCLTVHRALSHGFTKLKRESNSWKPDNAVGLKIYLRVNVEKTSEGRGGKAGWSGRGTLTHCALFFCLLLLFTLKVLNTFFC